MAFWAKRVEDIDQSDLQSLVENEVAERRVLEYKESLPESSDADKREFLADVSSFANSAGGHLIYGVMAKDGIPQQLCGLRGVTVDDEKLRLENLMRDCIDPRLPGVSIHPVDLAGSGIAFLLHIPRSYAGPHAVNFKGHWRFYARNSAGKYPMDVSEMRMAFLLSETAVERVRGFRATRLKAILDGETAVSTPAGPKIVLHVVPLLAFEPGQSLELSLVENDLTALPLLAIAHDPESGRYNFDGFVAYPNADDSGLRYAYTQLYRSGCIEAVDTTVLIDSKMEDINPSWQGPNDPVIIAGTDGFLLDCFPKYIALLKALGAQPPFFILLTFLGVKGFRIYRRGPLTMLKPNRKIDRENLILPEVVVDAYDADLPRLMKPAFDALWNAAGEPRSRNYDESGNWRPVGS